MDLEIPVDRLTVTHSRSGGPGGQNVNKVSSRVEVRFSLDAADWIPPEVRRRLRVLHRNRITKDGEFRVVCSNHRDQHRNLEDCLDRIRGFLRQAAERPKFRVKTAPSRGSRERRLREKRFRSERKRGRGAGTGEE
jgi:ribosome-associated protein